MALYYDAQRAMLLQHQRRMAMEAQQRWDEEYHRAVIGEPKTKPKPVMTFIEELQADFDEWVKGIELT